MHTNPTHGLLADGIETFVSKSGWETGIDKQVAEYVGETVKTRKGMDKQTVLTAHSQGKYSI